MAITIYRSNRVETLQSRLAEQIRPAPSADPFVAEIILVPTFAMARWLNLRLAQQQGIAANIHYPQMAAWVWTLASQLLDKVPSQDPYSQHALSWRIYSILPEMLDQPAFSPRAQYLHQDIGGIKRWQRPRLIGRGRQVKFPSQIISPAYRS